MSCEIIKTERLSKVFRTKREKTVALSDVNLSIEKGDIFGIIGLSGAGKSTLVRCMNLLEKPTEGKVYFKGKDLTLLTKSELSAVRKKIAMIFQGFNLLEQRNALKNVCFPMELIKIKRKAAVEKAEKLLQLVGLGDKLKSYPSQLSGGQKQRVAIARALATDPEVLLCDEATSALDPSTTDSILALLKNINEKLGVTVIIITHEMRVIESICNKVAVIDNSKIVECGPVDDVFADPQSDMGKKFICPAERNSNFSGGSKLRLIFNGESYKEPVISSLVIDCGAAVNILFAETKTLDGKVFGQMIIQIPNDERLKARVYKFLENKKVNYREVDGE